MKRTSLPFPHRSAPTERRRGLTADQDFDGHLADASRSLRVGTQRIAPGPFARIAYYATLVALTVGAWTAVPIPAEPEPSVEATPTPTPSPSRAKQRWPVTYAHSRLCLVRVVDVLRMRACRLAVP